ncbi:MAG: arsenite methyltransferase [Acidobacteria bacterium]|nr:arsenite methyltransferase [Acidobacteriota bacterium]
MDKKENIRSVVREGYGRIASNGGSCCTSTACCGGTAASAHDVARSVGYTAEELAGIPAGANLGLSCGNAVALAGLRPGETVVDLGSGAGFDVFQAGRKVGAAGRVIGVDMTPEMLDKARRNLDVYRADTGLDNVEFRQGEIEHLPLADQSVDVIISNCVINLSPDKEPVWREMYRVLKPGGRVAVSDLALRQPLPPAVVEMTEALTGCIAGAILVKETERMVRAAGFADVRLESKDDYVAAMKEWRDPLFARIAAHLPAGDSLADYVTSLSVRASKR